MELILTSFGVSHLPSHQDDNSNIFLRMPPVWWFCINKNSSLTMPSSFSVIGSSLMRNLLIDYQKGNTIIAMQG